MLIHEPLKKLHVQSDRMFFQGYFCTWHPSVRRCPRPEKNNVH